MKICLIMAGQGFEGGFWIQREGGVVDVCLPQGQRGFAQQFMAHVVYIADRYTKGRVRLIIKKNVWLVNYPRGSKK